MKTSLHLLAVSILCLCGMIAVPAGIQAQSAKIFVASFGNDANAGTSVAPKRSFQAAHDAVAAAGEIVVLDTAGYGLLTITKSVTITVPSGVNAFITAPSNTHAISVNAASSDIVVLRGLILEGSDTTTGSGIYATGVGELEVSDCKVRNFYYGIALAASDDTADHRLVARGCDVRDVGRGFIVNPPSSGAHNTYANLTDCTVDNAFDSAVYNSGDSSVDVLTLTRCALTDNGTAVYPGGHAVVYMDGCTFTHNTVAIAVLNNDANTITRGNNAFNSNGTDGSFVQTQALK